jgi:ABC-2 type transport system permease protein
MTDPSVVPDRAAVVATAEVGLVTSLRRSLTAELIKLRSLRSSVWLLLTAVGFTLTLGPLQSLGEVVGDAGRTVDDSAGAVSLALAGASTGALLLGVLGVLVVAGEYAPRAVRTTFMHVPRRSYVVVATAVALTATALVTAALAVAAAVSVTLAVLASAGLHVGWASPDVLRVSAATVWYLAGWGVLGQAAGWVTRSKLGGAALLVGVMLVLTPVLGLVPGRVGEVATALTPASAGAVMVGTERAAVLGTPGTGFLLWTAWLVGSTALAAWVVVRRVA